MNERTRFTLRVAAAITGSNPWACGYSEYRGTAQTLTNALPRIRRDNGGNTIMRLYHNGIEVPMPVTDVAASLSELTSND